MSCKREGCDNSIPYPRIRYCCVACERYMRRKAVHELIGDCPPPIPPEKIPERTPSEMQDEIDEIVAEVTT